MKNMKNETLWNDGSVDSGWSCGWMETYVEAYFEIINDIRPTMNLLEE